MIPIRSVILFVLSWRYVLVILSSRLSAYFLDKWERQEGRRVSWNYSSHFFLLSSFCNGRRKPASRPLGRNITGTVSVNSGNKPEYCSHFQVDVWSFFPDLPAKGNGSHSRACRVLRACIVTNDLTGCLCIWSF
jgi:hypothetical protein